MNNSTLISPDNVKYVIGGLMFLIAVVAIIWLALKSVNSGGGNNNPQPGGNNPPPPNPVPGGNPPTPAPGPTPAPQPGAGTGTGTGTTTLQSRLTWLGNHKWRFIIPVMFFLLVVALYWTGVLSMVFSDGTLLLGTVIIVTAFVVAGFRNAMTEDVKKKLVERLLFWVVVLVVGGLVYYKAIAPNIGSASSPVGSAMSSIGKLFEPAPVKWRGEKVVEAPVGKTVEVDFSGATCQLDIEGMFPLPQGRYEVTSSDWKRACQGGGDPKEEGCKALPSLGQSRKLCFRSLETEPVNLRISWR